jgi:hypothetical protein
LSFRFFTKIFKADINAMRALFASPQSLISDAINFAKKNHYIGYHIDFEPEKGVVHGDATLYANFVDTFAKALHKVQNISAKCFRSFLKINEN